jgi:ribose 5-phosphate isomerase B
MKIAIASDHAAVEERQVVAAHLRSEGHQVDDLGCAAGESVDYPDYGAKVARAVASGEAERGILICGTGIGICMAAGKVDGIRAAVVHDDFTAAMAREHNDANVMCMGARVIPASTMIRLADIFVTTAFGGDRHARRVAKIMALESRSDDGASVGA